MLGTLFCLDFTENLHKERIALSFDGEIAKIDNEDPL